MDPIDVVPLAAIPSFALIPFHCFAPPSLPSIIPKEPSVEVVSAGPSLLVSPPSPKQKDAAPIVRPEVFSPPVYNEGGGST